MGLCATLWLAGCQCASQARPARDPSASLRTPIGTNLDFLVDWSTAMPFVDLMKTSRPWIAGTTSSFDGGGTLDLDEHGWVRSLRPGQVARTLMVWDMTTHPAGRYVVLWDGEGELEYTAGATGRLVESESRPGRHVLDIDPRRFGPGIELVIMRTNPQNPVRNIRVLVPGGACSEDQARYCDERRPCGDAGECRSFEQIHREQVFHPDFLRSMRGYSAIRFMNWADANSTITREFETRWSDRTELEDVRWGPRAPLEVMIDLANRVHAEPWISLPSRADDDYARRAGELFRARLDPGLRVWVEYSNEVWNSMFPQHEYAADQGLRLGLSSDRYEAVLRYYSRRTGELHRAFGAGLGDASRMVRVYAGQSASPWVAEQILGFEGAGSRADAWAIAPYFGTTVTGETLPQWASLTPDEFFAREQASAIDVVREHVSGNLEIARQYGLPLVGYEGGQHYVGYDAAQTDQRIEQLFAAVNRDARMEGFYLRYLDAWRDAGGGLLMHHVDCAGGGRYGYWGASEYLGQPDEEAPKRRALMRWGQASR
ncbi:Cellulose-binding domain protein [Sandaracinus amylolyticus]|uniref:Cellulose-binding domain protein n=1 Tax=Sandaracinus amylolyticus TaxID=927083 RepID=A0A0F6VZ68_9BACT|nr:Cellulose-binding domain protein [Sandaracinus amylolyticus]